MRVEDVPQEALQELDRCQTLVGKSVMEGGPITMMMVYGFEWQGYVFLLKAPTLPIGMEFKETQVEGLRVLIGDAVFCTEIMSLGGDED